MTTYAAQVNQDANGVRTTSEYGDPGDGSTRWFDVVKVASGGTSGSTADAAVTDPANSGSVIALLKGLLTFARKSAAGILKGEDDAHTSGDAGVMDLGVINLTLAARAGADTDYSPKALGQGGEQFVTPSVSAAVTNSSPTNATTAAVASSLVVKASAGTLFGLSGYNSKASAQFIQIHDSATLPTDGAVPKIVITVPASSNFSMDLGIYGRRFTNGITVCNSSTIGTKTIGSADCWLDVQYK